MSKPNLFSRLSQVMAKGEFQTDQHSNLDLQKQKGGLIVLVNICAKTIQVVFAQIWTEKQFGHQKNNLNNPPFLFIIISMQIFKSSDFFSKFITQYFVVAFNEFYANISSSTWVDVKKPFNIYRFLWEFFKFCRSLLKKQQWSLIIDLIQKEFIISLDMLMVQDSVSLTSNPIRSTINSHLPTIHKILVQIVLRISLLDIGHLINYPSMEEVLPLRDLQKLVSHIRIISSSTDSQAQSNQTIQFIINKTIQKIEHSTTLNSMKTLLKKSELFQKHKKNISLQGEKITPKPSAFIEKFEDLTMKKHQQPKKIVVSERYEPALLIENQPLQQNANQITSTPQKKIKATFKIEQSIQRSVRVPYNNTKKMAQRTIFEVKNKKFIPKKIQYVVQTTAASSCSNTTSNFEFNFSKRNMYNTKTIRDDMNQIDKTILVEATPIKKDKCSVTQTCIKKTERFNTDGSFNIFGMSLRNLK